MISISWFWTSAEADRSDYDIFQRLLIVFLNIVIYNLEVSLEYSLVLATKRIFFYDAYCFICYALFRYANEFFFYYFYDLEST